jgi:hypothetical protein
VSNSYLTIARVAAFAVWAAAALGYPQSPGQSPPVQARQPEKAVAKPVSLPSKTTLPFVQGVCPPVRQPHAKAIPVLTDLYFRVPNPEYFKDQTEPGDLVTHVHELTHGVSNRLHATTKAHGIYLLEGRGIVLKHPKVTIEQVARAVPKGERGSIYDLYMVKQRKDWNHSPIYLLDEANAYIHGCLAHKQSDLGKKREETYRYAKEMLRYCDYLVKVVEQHDPNYPDLETLRAFNVWQKERLEKIADKDT